MGKTRVVLGHVERDQLFERADRVERVQVQPLVFDRRRIEDLAILWAVSTSRLLICREALR